MASPAVVTCFSPIILRGFSALVNYYINFSAQDLKSCRS